MFHMLYTQYFTKGKFHIFIISVVVFIVLNLLENVIHYSIGRHHGDLVVSITAPSPRDWTRIIGIMIIFAILQGVFTMALSSQL
jgi:hypothetical protein